MNTMVISQELKRHQTKPNCNDFGEEAMRRWWHEKDFSSVLNEAKITSDRDEESIVDDIVGDILNGYFSICKVINGNTFPNRKLRIAILRSK